MSQAVVIVVSLLVTLLLAYMSIRLGEFDISDFVVFNQYILQVYTPLGFLGTYWRFIRQAWSDIELVLDILSVDETITDPKNPVKAMIQTGEIEFKNVSFTYDSKMAKDEQRQILFNVSFKVPAGQSVALVGSTGSGKSTIMRLLYRFYELQEG
jgi:ABC-type multidrug transport system fused ATPase/permease subunit